MGRYPPSSAHLVTPEQLRDTPAEAGFDVEVWNDLTERAAQGIEAILDALSRDCRRRAEDSAGVSAVTILRPAQPSPCGPRYL